MSTFTYPANDAAIESDVFTCKLDWFFNGDNELDIDASAVVFNSEGQLIDAAYYNQLTCMDNAIVHSGDTKGNESREKIVFNTTKLAASGVKCVIVLASCYKTADLVNCSGMNCSFIDGKENKFHNLIVEDLDTGYRTGNFLFMLYRNEDRDNKWFINRVVEPVNARTFDACTLPMRQLLKRVYHPNSLTDYIAR